MFVVFVISEFCKLDIAVHPTAAPTFVNVAGIVLAYAGGVGTEETCTHFPRIRAGIGTKTIDFMSTLTVRTIPRTPRGEGRQEQNKSVLKYSWGRDGMHCHRDRYFRF